MSKSDHRIIIISVALGLVAWVMDTIFDYYIFYRPQGFCDSLILNIPAHEGYIHSVIFVLFIIFGFYINRYISRLAEVQERYRQLFDSVNDAIFLIGNNGGKLPGRIIEANKVAIEKLGYSRGELLHASPADLTDPEKLPEVPLKLEKLHVDGQILFETTLVSKEGRKIPVEINAHEVNLGGEVGVLSIVRDISERLEREKEIRRLASFPQYNPNPILEIDVNGVITYYNQAAARILEKLGVSEGPNAYLSEWKGVTEEIDRHGGQLSYREVKIGDSIFAERIHYIPELEVFRIYAVDITARKRGEQALRDAKDELENRVEERTTDLRLAYQKLMQEIESRRRAEQEVKESAERLRTLTFQIMNAEENERQRISETLHDELGQDLIYFKYQIINRLRKDKKLKIDFADLFQKLDSIIGKVRQISHYLSPTILEELGLTAAVKNLFEEFCRHFECACANASESDEGCELSSHPHSCTLLEADEIDNLLSHQAEVNVYRILQESLTNISKHSEANQVVVAVKKQDNNILFTVEDNGKGFDVQQAMVSGSAHNGIGIVSMQERVRMLGGSFTIESREGSGAKVSFIIPMERG